MNVFDLHTTVWHETQPGAKGCFLHSAKMTVGSWEFDANVVLPMHSHPHEQILMVTKGSVELTLGEEKRVLEAGNMVVVPPDVIHGVTTITRACVTDVFSPVREDFKKRFGE
jgi:quercetin dioxygenase-like cupin family protein